MRVGKLVRHSAHSYSSSHDFSSIQGWKQSVKVAALLENFSWVLSEVEGCEGLDYSRGEVVLYSRSHHSASVFRAEVASLSRYSLHGDE